MVEEGEGLKSLKSKKIKYIIFGVILTLVMSSAGLAGWLYFHQDTSPVPKEVRQKVSFPIYYPDSAKLPTGYTLNLKSFNTNGVVVVYTVSYEGNEKLVFTVQQKPSDNDIKGFYAKHMPLHNDIQTAVGTAAIGAIGQQTVVSLPTNSNAWLLVTGPLNTDQDRLKQVLLSIKRG